MKNMGLESKSNEILFAQKGKEIKHNLHHNKN